MSDCGCEIEIKDASQAKVLMVLLAINATMFVFELGLGWYALVILNGARHIILDAGQELAADVLAVAMESVAARRQPPMLIAH